MWIVEICKHVTCNITSKSKNKNSRLVNNHVIKLLSILRLLLKMSDVKLNGHTKMNGTEGKTPFLIGVAGGTASGKV